ncbi:MAG TPA: hypothetical protein VFK88_07115 [Gallionella sp.]|nr:hypothetical protein [Gallionella sp.]
MSIKMLLLVITILTSPLTYARQANIGCTEGDCQNGYGVFISQGGRKYVGDWKNGLPNGKGLLLVKRSSGTARYIGSFKDDKRDGTGTILNPDGSIYIGEFRDDKMYGHGTMYYQDGTRYEGEFKADKLNGEGVLVSPGKLRYEGSFKNNLPDGRGVLLNYINGSRKAGLFKEGKFLGK